MTESAAQTTPPSPLSPVDENWDRALAVVAHPDDMEFGTAAAVARWSRQGKHIAYVMVTSGEAGIDGMHPDEARQVREREQIASAELVGAQSVEFLGFPDGVIEYGVPLRRAITAVMRKHRPDIVITNNFREDWDGTFLNQADHIAVGRATLDAARDAGNRWIYTEQLDDGFKAWPGIRQVWAAGSPRSGHGVDITESFDAGVASLRAHEAYIDGLGWENFDAAEFLEASARSGGSRMGVAFASSFEVFDLGWVDDA